MKGTSSRNHGGRLEGKRCTRLREQQRRRPHGRTESWARSVNSHVLFPLCIIRRSKCFFLMVYNLSSEPPAARPAPPGHPVTKGPGALRSHLRNRGIRQEEDAEKV